MVLTKKIYVYTTNFYFVRLNAISSAKNLFMEKKENTRRSFLGKLMLGAGAMATAPVLSGFAKAKNEEQMKNAIKKVRALGFQWETLDPFLFCVHHEDYFPKGNDEMGPDANLLSGRNLGSDFHIKDGWRMYHGKKIPGFPGHPHRGFETLTVVRRGMVDHADSNGGAGRYGDGDLQWMTAGRGLMHSEMFPLLKKDKENPLELFQIWLNLSKSAKMTEPDYKMFWGENIPKFEHEDSAYVEVMTGELLGKKAPAPPKASWAHDPANHVGVYNIKIRPGKSFTLPATAPGVNRTLYFYDGNSLTVDGQNIPEYHAADVEPDRDLKLAAGNEEAKVLVLQGKPINEPVVQHGPFVMNSRQEIQQAFEEYQQTQFGGWPWSRYDQVHDRSKGRFARYADGSEEVKS